MHKAKYTAATNEGNISNGTISQVLSSATEWQVWVSQTMPVRDISNDLEWHKQTLYCMKISPMNELGYNKTTIRQHLK